MVKPKRRQRANGALLAWVSIGVVVAVVLTVVLVKTLDSSSPEVNKFGPASPTVFHEVTNVPASVFNTIGVTSPTISVVPSTVFGVLKGQPKLVDASTGLPLAFYWGAEFCPYCAATRWGIIIALSRFGTFDKLYNMFSSATDPAGPNTPTFTFYKVTYTSKYLAFKGYEVEDRNGKKLMTPPANINAARRALQPRRDLPVHGHREPHVHPQLGVRPAAARRLHDAAVDRLRADQHRRAP